MITVKNLEKTYISKHIVTPVLKGIDLEVKEGEFVAIMGRSGAGKSTLLYQIGLLDRPTKGSIRIDGVNVLDMTTRQRTKFRLDNLGYVFQDYALVPDLTAAENVMIPLVMSGISKRVAYDRAVVALDRFGLGERVNNRPNQLSGGEQQRVSIARAIIQKPKILFADELTANLDSVSADMVLDIISELHREGQTIVMVTHEIEYTKSCDRIITIGDGIIESDKKVKR
jgi:putative ABC transport system ATP-binding protein